MKAWLTASAVACAVFAVSGWNAAGAATPSAGDRQVVREYRAEAALDVDAQGKVAAAPLSTDVPAALAGPAREAIGQWRFKPPTRDGQPVTARTWARITLQLLQQPDGNYGLRAVFASNGPKLTFTRLPQYPRNEIRQRGQGKLVMEAIVHPDGTLTDIHVASQRFNHPDASAFRESAEEVMRQAQAEPELVDGKPVATRVQVPFVYALQSVSRSEALSRMVHREAGEAAEPDFSPIGEVVALDSPVQLILDPQG